MRLNKLPVRPRLLLLLCALIFAALPATATAAGSSQNPQNGAMGFEGTIGAPAPTQAATIGTPANGQVFTSTPITVNGLCKTGLLVKVFSNNIFVGAAQCTSGSYNLKVDLFSGRNDLVSRVFDSLDQSGPDSNVVSVTFNDAQFIQIGTRVNLTSGYAKLGANPGSVLSWPIVLSGGAGPYAISTDWGDGTSPTLQSQSFTGTFTIKHTYANAGLYNVIVRATDANGTSAFLQLVGVANGKVTQGTTGSGTTGATSGGGSGRVIYEWWPSLICIPLILVGFWLGRRHELYSIRKHLEQSRQDAS